MQDHKMIPSTSIAEINARLASAPSEATLRAHLEHCYGSIVKDILSLDVGVYRVDWQDRVPWVVRAFPPDRPFSECEGDAQFLDMLAQLKFPAERCAADPSVTNCNGQAVLVTLFVAGERVKPGPKALKKLGGMLGYLHTLQPPSKNITIRDGRSWHHLSLRGGAAGDIANARVLVQERKVTASSPDQILLWEKIQHALAKADDLADLPIATFSHPDYVPSNTIRTEKDGLDLVLVDWTGAGSAPRIGALGFLLFAAAARSMERIADVVDSYSMYIKLQPAELERLSAAIRLRPLLIASWEAALGRKPLIEVVSFIDGLAQQAEDIASIARARILRE